MRIYFVFSLFYAMRKYYLLVTEIMNVTAIIEMEIPAIIFVVSGSSNINVPTTMAVIGSNTPSTDAFVAPMFLDAIANVEVEITVGSRANPKRLSQSCQFVIPVVIVVSELMILHRNTIVPIVRA